MTDDDTFFAQVLDAMSDGVYFVDRERRITYWSKGAERLSGFRAEDVVGRHCWDATLNHVDDQGVGLCGSRCPLLASMRDGVDRDARIWMHHREGHLQPVSVRASPLRDAATGQVTGAVEVFSDDTAAVAAARRLAELEELSLADALTGVGNRRRLDRELEARLDAWRRYHVAFGVLFLDLDRFKSVNDGFGHGVGDEALRLVGRTLGYGVRPSDTVARIGGEEFVVVLPHVQRPQLVATAERLRALVASTRLVASGVEVPLRVSVGGSLVTADDDASALLRRADRLLYQAKIGGRDTCRVDGEEA